MQKILDSSDIALSAGFISVDKIFHKDWKFNVPCRAKLALNGLCVKASEGGPGPRWPQNSLRRLIFAVSRVEKPGIAYDGRRDIGTGSVRQLSEEIASNRLVGIVRRD